jgi:hypothetical protein
MNATEKILSVYDKEQLKEIANHGCQSGVCHEHIYYGDTIKFYDTYEVQILDELVLNYGYDLLIDLFKENNANLTWYKNAVVWAFIELTAIEAIEDAELAPAKMLDEWNNSFEVIPSGSKVEALGNKIMAMGL